MNRSINTARERQFAKNGGKHSEDGFSLFETLLALALMMVVVSAIQSAVFLNWKYRTAGAEQCELALSEIAVAEDIGSDLRNATVDVARNAMSNQESTSKGTSFQPELIQQTKIRERFLELQHATSTYRPIGFAADSSWMTFNTLHPNSRFSKHEQEGHWPPKQVVWFVNDGRTLRIPFRRTEGGLNEISVSPDQFPFGLTRVEFPSIGIHSYGTNEIHPTNSDWTHIDDSVKSVEFQFFDGDIWKLKWSKRNVEEIPDAVRMKLIREVGHQSFTVRLPQRRRGSDKF